MINMDYGGMVDISSSFIRDIRLFELLEIEKILLGVGRPNGPQKGHNA